MARKKIKTVYFRRKRERKTDYKMRLGLLKSDKPRLIIRVTATSIITQVAKFNPAGDRILLQSSSYELKKEGLNMKGNNISSCYLVGLNIGTKAKKAKISEAILDMGIKMPVKGSRVYAALKGAIDAGLNVSHSKDIFPSEERITGKHISDYAKKLKEKDAKKYETQFSGYIKKGIKPENIAEEFTKMKNKIISG